MFLPWYGISFTATGIAFMQQAGQQFATEYGNAALQSYLGGFHATLGSLAGQELGAVSAHQVLKNLNIVFLIIAGFALIDALLALARAGTSFPDGAGSAVALLGFISAVCVLFRMVDRPNPASQLMTMSLREGAWIALIGSLAMVGGGLWQSSKPAPAVSDANVRSAWSGLSGWTPEG